MQRFWAGLIGVTLLCAGGLARAQCTKDIECKGERVCNDGKCVDPAPAPVTPPAVEPATEPVPTSSEPERAHASTARAPTQTEAPAKLDGDDHFFADGERPYKAKKHLKNPALLAAGIVITASAPIVIVVAAATSTCDVHGCDTDHRVAVASLGAFVLVGLGVPLIVIGAKRAPFGQALLVPWAGKTSAGVTLDLRL